MEQEQFKFKKSFGQNFLKDINIVKKIVNSAEIKEKALVIEIGPGAGILTKELAKVSNQVLAYEIDFRLEDILANTLKEYDNIDIIFDDFLNRNVGEDLKNYTYDHLYVVSNLPYYITTPIITKLIEDDVDVEKIVVMVQKEVGDRFAALPGTKDYNSLTVFLNYYFDIKKLFVVNRNQFVPRPNVDSVIVSLTQKVNKLEIKDKKSSFLLFEIVLNLREKR